VGSAPTTDNPNSTQSFTQENNHLMDTNEQTPIDEIGVDLATPDESPPDDTPTVPDNTPDDVALVRDFIVAADTGLIPELITGATVSEVLASVAAARAAYQRVVEQVRVAGPPVVQVAPEVPSMPAVPAGGAAAFVVDPGDLPSGELIRRGISAARRVGG